MLFAGIHCEPFLDNLWGHLLLLAEVLFYRIMLLIFAYALFLWILFNTAWSAMGEWNVKHLWNEIYAVAIGISIFTYFKESKDHIGFAKTIRYTLIFIIITALMTIFTSFIDSMYVRNMFMKTNEGDMSN